MRVPITSATGKMGQPLIGVSDAQLDDGALITLTSPGMLQRHHQTMAESALEDIAADTLSLWMDNNRAKAELGWVPGRQSRTLDRFSLERCPSGRGAATRLVSGLTMGR